MQNITPESISPHVRGWFGTQIEHLAMRHDLAGPQIAHVRQGKYKIELRREFGRRALVAIKNKEIALSAVELDCCCERAATELIRIREIRAAHAAGQLSTEVMRQLPVYAAYKAYLDEDSFLVMCEVMAVALDLKNQPVEEVADKPLAQLSHPTHPISAETQAWMEVRTIGLALADDTGGPSFGNISRKDYIKDAALRVRNQARLAIRIGDLNAPAEDLDQICWTVAREAYLLRSLKAAEQAGELTHEDIQKMPTYGPYKDYFELGDALVAMAESIGAAVGQPIKSQDVQN